MKMCFATMHGLYWRAVWTLIGTHSSQAQLNGDLVKVVLELEAGLGYVKPCHEPFFVVTGFCLATMRR